MTKELNQEFDGIGEVRGYLFKQILKKPKAYLYEVTNQETDQKHYEIFKRTISKLYDFGAKERIEEKAVVYPKSKSFGIWAWTSKDFIKAVDIYESLT
ncbi:MAG: hypothetical protein KKF62_18495 [Bacteroidetes bacterium]|nr:hypothetical protein [Bacteroidota bacterium]MBU1114374.1 hypothetical protein [Bacteroidota bacterium]MBU1798331.1 hypothetical protein [Bacteroidota bacterium]